MNHYLNFCGHCCSVEIDDIVAVIAIAVHLPPAVVVVSGRQKQAVVVDYSVLRSMVRLNDEVETSLSDSAVAVVDSDVD